MLERNCERSRVDVVKAGREAYSRSALFKERARKPSRKDGVLLELELQPKKTLRLPRVEPVRFNVGAGDQQNACGPGNEGTGQSSSFSLFTVRLRTRQDLFRVL